jgi:hypothetical protein
MGFRTGYVKYGTYWRIAEARRPLWSSPPFFPEAGQRPPKIGVLPLPQGKGHPYLWRHRDPENSEQIGLAKSPLGLLLFDLIQLSSKQIFAELSRKIVFSGFVALCFKMLLCYVKLVLNKFVCLSLVNLFFVTGISHDSSNGWGEKSFSLGKFFLPIPSV